MKKEYDEREGIRVDELGITRKELTEMKELDMMYGGRTTKEELDDIKEEEEQLLLDPYLKKKERRLTPQ